MQKHGHDGDGSARGNWRRRRSALTAIAAAVLASACAAPGSQQGGPGNVFTDTFANSDPCSNNARNIGIAVGTIGGAVIGGLIGNKKPGAVVGGGVAGGAIGALIGIDIDRKRCALAQIAKNNNLEVTFQDIRFEETAPAVTGNRPSTPSSTSSGLSASFSDRNGQEAQFLSGSDELTERAKSYFAAIAQQYAPAATPANATADEKNKWAQRARDRKLLLVGHTDDTGSSRLNAELSERRARKVADFLGSYGIARNQLYFQGAGEGYPIRSNVSEEGRAANRRVEFIELDSAESLARYIDTRRPRYDFYRDAEATAAPVILARRTPGTAPTTSTAAAKESGRSTASIAPTPAPPSAANQKPPAAGIDFGGKPLTATSELIDIGTQKVGAPQMSLISNAQAAPFLSRCDKDRPRFIGKVKELQGNSYSTAEHLPGLYGTTWADMVAGNLVLLNRVSLLRDGATPDKLPDLKFYPRYDASKAGSAVPAWQGSPQVNVYQGSNGILYRMFVGGAQGVQCVDILFPTGGGTAARKGKVIYGSPETLQIADFQPKKQ